MVEIVTRVKSLHILDDSNCWTLPPKQFVYHAIVWGGSVHQLDLSSICGDFTLFFILYRH